MEPMTLDNTHPVLPPELWNEILKLLPAADQRTCLHLSRSFHDATQRLIFSRTKICLGIPSMHPWNAHEGIASAMELVQMAKQAKRAQELLVHITHNTEFAHIIRELTIHACALRKPNLDTDIFLGAFQNLTRLNSFTWLCSRPPLRPQLLAAIVKASAPTLTYVQIPATWQCIAQLAHLPNLHRLALVRSQYEDRRTVERPSDPTALDPEVFKANGNTLRGIFFRGLDRASFLVAPLLSQCFNLRSLSIRTVSAPLLCMLGAMRNSLPHLVSFRLIYSTWRLSDLRDLDDGLHAVASFIRNRLNLVRLDVTPEIEKQSCTAIDLTPVLEVLRELTALRTLGIGMTINCDEDLQTLDQFLPDRLSALLLIFTVTVTSTPQTCIDPDILVDRLIKKCPRLRYIHVFPTLFHCRQEGYLRLLEQPLSMLELVGWRRQLSYVVRDQFTGAIAHTELWPADRVVSGTIKDFGSEDWRWLLSAHVTEGPIGTLIYLFASNHRHI
ncbi:hypothetical protein C2E23DRAFT_137181 [Lenzites betulinus]|nr:hypothetical protein C2E23DRAFT_137181 [Lenzites betulinus]